MTRIAHLSDVHFGANDPAIVAASEAWLQAARPDLVIVSGDFTQRARAAQFAAAAAWLARLRAGGQAVLTVPGNHDIPLYDVIRRFAAPLVRYKRYIDDELCPWFENDAVAVLGINTARSLTIKDGRINAEQIKLMQRRFAGVAATKTRILVTHHPLFALPIGRGGELSEAVGRHDNAVRAATDMGIDIALAGHFHRTYASAAGRMAENMGRALVIQAGTATSTRLRNEEPQSFNLIEIAARDRIALQVIAWDGREFAGGDKTWMAFDGQTWRGTETIGGGGEVTAAERVPA